MAKRTRARKSERTALDEARLRKLNAEADQAEMEALRKRGDASVRLRRSLLTAEDVHARLKGEVDRAGSRTALAKRWRCHRSVIDDAVNRGVLSPTILRRLRLTSETIYRGRAR